MSGISAPRSHAAMMDDVYRYQRYIYDFTRKYYLFGRDRLIRQLALSADERVVEIGCGTARNLIRMARRYPQARFYGLDASAQMLKTARQKIAQAGLEGRIRVAEGYAEALDPSFFAISGFERAIFSYSLSMIPDWNRALAAAAASLVPGGRLHIVDFGDLTGLGVAGKALMRAWLGLFHVEPRATILARLEALRGSEEPALAGRLELLPGRYAFIFEGSTEVLPGLMGNVAVATQP